VRRELTRSIEKISIVLSVLIATVLYSYAEPDAGSAFGRAIGSSIIPFVIAFFSSKGRSDQFKAWAYGISTLVVIGVASIPFYEGRARKQAAQSAVEQIQRVVELQEKIIAQDKPAPDEGASSIEQKNHEKPKDPVKAVIDLLAEYKKKEFAMTNSFQSSDAVKDIVAAVQNGSLYTSLEGLRQFRVALATYERRYKAYAEELGALKKNFIQQVRTEFTNPKELEAFERSLQKSEARMKRLIAIDSEMVKLYRSTADLLEPAAAFGQVSIDSQGNLRIENETILGKFNANTARLQMLAAEQEELAKEMIAAQKKAMDGLKKF
jgi:hypothetical protein